MRIKPTIAKLLRRVSIFAGRKGHRVVIPFKGNPEWRWVRCLNCSLQAGVLIKPLPGEQRMSGELLEKKCKKIQR